VCWLDRPGDRLKLTASSVVEQPPMSRVSNRARWDDQRCKLLDPFRYASEASFGIGLSCPGHTNSGDRSTSMNVTARSSRSRRAGSQVRDRQIDASVDRVVGFQCAVFPPDG